MWPLVAIIAGIIVLLHYLSSSDSQTQKPHWQENRQNKAGWAVPKATMSRSDGCESNDSYLSSSKSQAQKPYWQDNRQNKGAVPKAMMSVPPCCMANDSNCTPLDALEWSRPIVGNVMEALIDPNIDLIGVYVLDDGIKDTLFEIVDRRIQQDALFNRVLTATVAKRTVKEIQEEIAGKLKLTFSHKSERGRAQELIKKIKTNPKILVVLYDLHKKLDLGKVGIPYGSDHTGCCKIILTSTTEDVLSNHMRTHKNFSIV